MNNRKIEVFKTFRFDFYLENFPERLQIDILNKISDTNISAGLFSNTGNFSILYKGTYDAAILENKFFNIINKILESYNCENYKLIDSKIRNELEYKYFRQFTLKRE